MSTIDTQTPGSPGWYLNSLGTELQTKTARLDKLQNYALGHHPLPEAGSAKSRQAFEAFLKKSRTNYPALVSEAVRELLIPVGFRTAIEDGELGDKAANRIWQANSLDADSGLVMGAALNMGEGYAIVGPVDPETGEPVITPEDPRQVVTRRDPIRPRRTVAGLKTYRDPQQGADFAYLYLPSNDGRINVVTAYRPLNAIEAKGIPFSIAGWEFFGDVQTLNVTRNPVVRFRNRPQLDGNVLGEFEDVLDIVDRINSETYARMVIVAVQAFKQRAIKGIKTDAVDADGAPIDWGSFFEPGADSLWIMPEGAEITEFSQSDMSPILAATSDDVQALAAVTRTPAYYLTGNMEYAKAGTADLARSALEAKAVDRMREYGESWEQVISLAFEFKGDIDRARAVDTETIWQPPQRHTMAEQADAASKLNGILPPRTLLQKVFQFTPTELDRIESERADAELFTPALNNVATGLTDGNA